MPVGPVVRDDQTATFFDGTAQGLFLLPHCPEGHASSPHAQQCDTCGATDLSWVPATGDATVVSWAVIPGRLSDAGAGSPTVLAVAELTEGPWWWSQVVDADPAQMMVGARLAMRFERHSPEHEAVPVFALANPDS